MPEISLLKTKILFLPQKFTINDKVLKLSTLVLSKFVTEKNRNPMLCAQNKPEENVQVLV